MKRNW